MTDELLDVTTGISRKTPPDAGRPATLSGVRRHQTCVQIRNA